jgi:hypothetical protein
MPRFDALHTVVGRMPRFDESVIREERSFENRRLEWVRAHAGPVARAFADALPADYQNADTLCSCDLTFFKKGWRYSAKGQWHTHGVPPSGAQDRYHRSLRPPILAVAGRVSLTRYLLGELVLPEARLDWDAELRRQLASGALSEHVVEEGALVVYGWGDFHRSVPATDEGWRVLLSAWNGAGELESEEPVACVENSYGPLWPSQDEAAFAPYRVTAPPHDPPPRSHRSQYRLLGAVPALEPENETPLFAADVSFARRNGGASTQAFLDALPDDWRASRLVIDSFLNWLPRGCAPGWDRFHFEPYPAQLEGARGAANWEQGFETLSCVFSTQATPEFLVGEVEFEGDLSAQLEKWRFCTNLERRHRELLAQVARGSLIAEKLPGFRLYTHGWGDFFRMTPAETSGFHFRIRATRGTLRPFANLIRNLASADPRRF